MKNLKLLFVQAMMISAAILFVIGVSEIFFHFKGYDSGLEWYIPISIFIAGVLCAIPTVIFKGSELMSKAQFRIRLVAHCLVLYAEIAVLGFIFTWYDNLQSFIGISLVYIYLSG